MEYIDYAKTGIVYSNTIYIARGTSVANTYPENRSPPKLKKGFIPGCEQFLGIRYPARPGSVPFSQKQVLSRLD